MDDCTKSPQLEEGENLNTGALGTRRTPLGGTSALARQAQGGPSPAFMKENIDVLRTMIKELDKRGQEKVTPRNLFNEKTGETGSENFQMSPSTEEVGGYSSDGSSRSRSRGRPRSTRKNRKSVSKYKGISKSYRSIRSEAQSRSKSKSVKSKPQSVRAFRRNSSSNSGYDTVSDSGSEDLSMPYRRPKPMPFTSRITRFRYHRWAKLPPNVRVYKWNKDPEDHLSIFSAAAEQEEWPMLFSQQKRYDKDPTEIHGIKRKPNEGLQAFMDRFKAESAHMKGVPPVLRIYVFMHGHDHPELAKKLNDKIPKTVDEMWERVGAFIRGETAADTTEAIRSPRWEKKGFTPLTKTPREILAMDNVNFPPPPPMVGTPKKQNMNKFCDYHQDRGHNTNDCYHLKKQIEEAVALGRLAPLVKDIRQGGQKSKGSTKGKEKVINLLMNFPVVVEAMIEGFRVRRTHVDGGSSSEVMYEHCFRNLSYRMRSRLRESRIPLVGFSGEVSYLMRVIDLEVTIGERGRTGTVKMEFAMRPGKEPMQLDDMEGRRQPDKGRKPPKSGTKEKIVVNDNYPEQLVTIGGGLSAECRHTLIHTLRKNVDIFAWTPADITGIPKAITEHSLDTYPHIEPKAQKKRGLDPDMRKVVTDEVNEWLKADLNKACPKDLYPLPEIDWKIESLMGFQYKCLLYAYKGYQQIQMTKKDEEKTAFYTEEGVNLEAYVGDMVIKSRTEQDIIKDIEQTFSTLRRINMKLNPKKCSFGMEEGKFLGYIVTSEGIRVNPKKAKAVMDMPSPKTLKQMQSLKAVEVAFLEMKKLVSEFPTLTTNKKGETLMMYLAATNKAVSAVLLTERDGRQMSIHYFGVRSVQQEDRPPNLKSFPGSFNLVDYDNSRNYKQTRDYGRATRDAKRDIRKLFSTLESGSKGVSRCVELEPGMFARWAECSPTLESSPSSRSPLFHLSSPLHELVQSMPQR
ncbi:hypothetical protein Tco_0105705 [Tanacetum coccineum]